MAENLKFKPWGNMALIEVEKEYAGIARNDAGEQSKKGVLIDFSLAQIHLTESGGFAIPYDNFMLTKDQLEAMVGYTVSYQEYADSGRKIEVDGREFVEVPWYRITGIWEKESIEKEAK